MLAVIIITDVEIGKNAMLIKKEMRNVIPFE